MRYYYKDENGNYYAYKSKQEGLEEITEQEWNIHQEALNELIKEDSHAIEDEIAKLKIELSKTDYQALKYFEGWISEEDYLPIKAQRQELRDKINDLENKL